jgi:hypothetical protein
MITDLVSEVKHAYNQLTLSANKRLHFSLLAAAPVSYVPGGITTYLLAEHGIDPSINVACTALAKSTTNFAVNSAVYHYFSFGHSSIKSAYENSANLFKTLLYSSIFGVPKLIGHYTLLAEGDNHSLYAFGIPYVTLGILGYLFRTKFHLHDGMATFTPRVPPSPNSNNPHNI